MPTRNTPDFTTALHTHFARQWDISLANTHVEIDHFNAQYVVTELGSGYAPRRVQRIPMSQAEDITTSSTANERICNMFTGIWGATATISHESNHIVCVQAAPTPTWGRRYFYFREQFAETLLTNLLQFSRSREAAFTHSLLAPTTDPTLTADRAFRAIVGQDSPGVIADSISDDAVLGTGTYWSGPTVSGRFPSAYARPGTIGDAWAVDELSDHEDYPEEPLEAVSTAEYHIFIWEQVREWLDKEASMASEEVKEILARLVGECSKEIVSLISHGETAVVREDIEVRSDMVVPSSFDDVPF